MTRMQSQLNSMAEQVTRPLGRTLAAQLEPVLRASRVQAQSEIFQSAMDNQSAIRKALEPMLLQVAEQQRSLTEGALSSITKSIQLPRISVEPIITPELAAALQRINENLRVPLAFPDEDGFDKVSELIDAGEIDETVLETAELGLGSDASLQVSIDEAANALAKERKGLSRARARQVVVFCVWLAWVGVLVGFVFLEAPVVGVVAGALNPRKATGIAFDTTFPPKEDPTDY